MLSHYDNDPTQELRQFATLVREREEDTMTRPRRAKGPRKAQRIPEVLTAEERAALLTQTTPRYPTGLRNRCLMLVMLDCGLRAREALQLAARDIDWQSGKLKVRQGKGKKDRVLWLNEEALEWLRKWLVGRPRGEGGGVFVAGGGGRRR